MVYINKYKKYKYKYKKLKRGGNLLKMNSYLDNLYKNIIIKYNIPANSRDNLLKGSHIYQTYGTILNTSIDDMITIIGIKQDDIFYDLGSGIGNVCFKMLLSANVKKAVGYEIVASRYKLANYIKDAFIRDYPQYDGKVQFKLQNFSKLLDKGKLDATILFTDSIMFSIETLKLVVNIANQCPNLRYLISMKKIPFLHELKNIECIASWGKSQYYVYRIK